MNRLKRISAFCIGVLTFLLLSAGVFAAGLGGYRVQLNELEQQVYDNLVENLANRTASFRCAFDPPLNFGSEQSAQSALQSATFRAYEAVYRDHPEFFWVDKDGGISVRPEISAGGGSYQIASITMTTKFHEEASIPQKQKELEARVSAILEKATGSDYEKLKTIHDAIVNGCAYSLEAKASPARYPDAYEAYGALVDGSAVCEGYAKAFKLLCDRLDIPCVLVGGNAGGENHMWNYVRLDGAYYLVDATFDDPVGGSPTSDYFLKGSDSTSSHRPGGGFLQGFDAQFIDPSLSQKDYASGTAGNASRSSESAQAAKKSCEVRYSASGGGSYEVAFGSSVGPIDNGQILEGGTVISVWALPQDGFELEEIRVEMGDTVISESARSEIYFKLTDDCRIRVSFRRV